MDQIVNHTVTDQISDTALDHNTEDAVLNSD